jgi:hypothetical protein
MEWIEAGNVDKEGLALWRQFEKRKLVRLAYGITSRIDKVRLVLADESGLPGGVHP